MIDINAASTNVVTTANNIVDISTVVDTTMNIIDDATTDSGTTIFYNNHVTTTDYISSGSTYIILTANAIIPDSLIDTRYS